ncbi:MAG: hypothetical protein EOP62_10890 [Sphingomonadales bacterium]|nr:MAG: hypothetical protein EOP62_10890 [Sphingomonadales bacterium]
MIVDHALLQQIWASLNAPTRAGTPHGGRALLRRIAEDGWMYRHQLEDLAYAFDPRIEGFDSGFDLAALVEPLGYRWQAFYSRPRMRSIETGGGEGLCAADAAGFLLRLESLGFSFDAAVLIEALRPAIARRKFVTGAELDLFWWPKMRGKSKIVLEVDDTSLGFAGITAGKFANGYRYEIWLATDGSICTLGVKSPKYREAPRPVETECAACGYKWTRGDPDSSTLHRKEHKHRMIALDPQPHAQLLEARGQENDPDLVDAQSPRWKHAEMHRRAWAFKREMRFDFVQWDSPDSTPDPDVQGFLLSDDEGRIQGAVSFRWRQVKDRSEPGCWGLDWVWICPPARRSGVLSRVWPMLRERFGDFHVEGPVSEAMQALLANRGETFLMTWPSSRTASIIDA